MLKARLLLLAACPWPLDVQPYVDLESNRMSHLVHSSIMHPHTLVPLAQYSRTMGVNNYYINYRFEVAY